jgi:hypothetical protein
MTTTTYQDRLGTNIQETSKKAAVLAFNFHLTAGLFESVDANGDLLNKSRSIWANVTSAEHNAIARKLAAQVWNNNLFLPPLF